MRKSSVIGFVLSLIAAVALIRYLQSGPPPNPSEPDANESVTDEAPSSSPEPEAVRPPTPVPLQTVAPSLSPMKPSPAPISEEKPGGVYRERVDWVEFKVDGDLAIAFGDVIVGAVKDAPFKVGRIKPTKTGLWDTNEIPFHIDEKLPNKQRVLDAIDYFQRETVVKFKPFSGEKDAIVFMPRSGHCASYLGRIGGHQPIYLDDKCGKGEIIHEIMHALGFVHEHSRTDRDQYVEVAWENILPEFLPQFGMVPDSLVHEYVGSVFDFDYNSIMLYPPNAFAINAEQPTLRSRSNRRLEPAKAALSEVDKERLYYLYGQ